MSAQTGSPPKPEGEDYAVFIKCTALSSSTPATMFVAALDCLDQFIRDLGVDCFPNPHGAGMRISGANEAVRVAQLALEALGAAGIPAAAGVDWGRFIRVALTNTWNAAARPLNRAARLAFSEEAKGRVLVTPKVADDAEYRFSGVRQCEAKDGFYAFHELEGFQQRIVPQPALGEVKQQSHHIVLWDIVKYSQNHPDDQARLCQTLANAAYHAADSHGLTGCIPTGDGGYLLCSSSLGAVLFAQQLLLQSEGVKIRVGIHHGPLAEARRGPVGPHVLRADKVSGAAPSMGLAMRVFVWESLPKGTQSQLKCQEDANDRTILIVANGHRPQSEVVQTCPRCGRRYAPGIKFCTYDGAALYEVSPGTVLGKKYRIDCLLGAGGMGEVWRATHLHFNEARAIKVLRDANPKLKQALLSEAKIVRALAHPNIVRVEDIDETEGGQLFVVMEFIDGQSLSERIKQKPPLNYLEAVRIVVEVCQALDCAHNQHIIHRDIKPQNIMLAHLPDGREAVKLIDFGIAKIVADVNEAERGALETASEVGVFKGTIEYASPEQARGVPSRALDFRTDIYSLGVVFYFALTGTVPFAVNPEEPLRSLQERTDKDPLSPHKAFPAKNIPLQVSECVMRALQRNPADRYQSAREMGSAALRAITSSVNPQDPIATSGAKKIDERTNESDGLVYLWIPPGIFRMGEAFGDEQPIHEVSITKGFWISQTPVTQRAYRQVLGESPSRFRGDDLPVENVSWHDAQRYCVKRGLRLPTEAEWEYAARGLEQSHVDGSSKLGDFAWYAANSGRMTQPVASKEANVFGLHDMLGNVWEWVSDFYGAEYYSESSANDPRGPDKGASRVIRGGSWGDPFHRVTVSARGYLHPDSREGYCGFRCINSNLAAPEDT